MVTLNLKNNKNLPNKNSLSFFYAIYDVYFDKHQPINDTEMVKILKKDYNLDIERKTIKRYRDFLINNFDIELIHKKKGYYVKPKVGNQKIQIIKDIIDKNEHENHILSLSIEIER